MKKPLPNEHQTHPWIAGYRAGVLDTKEVIWEFFNGEDELKIKAKFADILERLDQISKNPYSSPTVGTSAAAPQFPDYSKKDSGIL